MFSLSTTSRNACVQMFASLSAASHDRSTAVHLLAAGWFRVLNEVRVWYAWSTATHTSSGFWFKVWRIWRQLVKI